MTEPLFLPRSPGLTAGEIAELTGSEPRPGSTLDRRVTGISSLDEAGPAEVAFLDNPAYVGDLTSTRAGICIVARRFAGRVPSRSIGLVAAEPFRAFVTVAQTLYPDALRPSSLFAATGIAAGAQLHPSARVENRVVVDPGAVIGPDVRIGRGTVIAATAVIGPSVHIGRGCAIGAGATVMNSLVGDRVIIHPGCRIGQDGFGYVMGSGAHVKVPQVGRVILQDDVEIGAGTTIDRGANRDTIVGEGSKIDNLVQVGHNVVIGRHCVIVAQSGISGSVTVGDFVVLGARVGVNNHVTIGEGAQIAATSIVHGDVPAGARWGGTPAKPIRQWFREMLLIERLARQDAASPSAKPAGERERG